MMEASPWKTGFLLAAILFLASATVLAQSPVKTYTPPKTAWEDPDLPTPSSEAYTFSQATARGQWQTPKIELQPAKTRFSKVMLPSLLLSSVYWIFLPIKV